MKSLCRIAALILAGVAGHAYGQSATLRVTHNDPDGLVSPGQTVTVTATFAWTGNSGLGRVAGSVRATDNLGVASNPVFPYTFTPLPATVIQPGSPSGGSLLDVFIQSGDSGPFFGMSPWYPFGLQTGLQLTRFEWTAPALLGVVEFDWVPDPGTPLPLMHPFQFFSAVPIPTTYLGTSLTVVPAPASGLLLASGVLAAARRRRRT